MRSTGFPARGFLSEPDTGWKPVLLRLRRVRRGFGGLAVALFANHFVADAVLHGRRRVEESVALAVLADAIGRLPGALGQDVDQRVLRLEDLLGLDLDVRRLTVHAAE